MVVMYQTVLTALLLLFGLHPKSLPLPSSFSLSNTLSKPTGPSIFAHYMLITRPPDGDYTNDINLAKAAGIDAFAINYGGYNVDFDVQRGYLADFYEAATALNFKIFLSIDCTSVTDAGMVVSLVNQYANSSAQFFVDNAILLTTFQTTDPLWNWQADVLNKIPHPVFFLPGSLSDDATSLFTKSFAQGAFPWIHPTKTADEEYCTDQAYAAARNATGGSKKWMAAIAPWFFKRLDAADNWSQAQDDSIWVDRWSHLLALKPDFIEIVTWNDWGESSYIGPADTTNVSPISYWDTLDHAAFRKMAAVYIKAYKAGQTSIAVDSNEENIFCFYRLQPAAVLGTTDSLPLPSNASYLHDNVFVVPFLSAPADITLTSGGNAHYMHAPAGVSKMAVPWTLGAQSISAARNGVEFVSKSGPDILGQLIRYNGNVVTL